MKISRAKHVRRTSLSLAAIGTLLPLFGSGVASAANLTWDTAPGTVGAGNGTITDGAGTWDNATANFTVDGGANNIAWSNSTNANDIAVFGGSYNSTTGTAIAGGNVTVGSGGITLGGISLIAKTSPNFNIGGGALTLGPATGTISLASSTFNPSLTISSVIAGGALNVTPTSGAFFAGLTLSGSNTYTGGTTLGTATVLSANNNSALGTGALTVNGNFVNLNSGTSAALANNISMGTFGITINSGTLTLNGALTGTGALNKTTSGDLTLGGASTGYSGTINLRAGTLRVQTNDSALGTGQIVVSSGTANAALTATLATQSGGGARTLSNTIAINNNGTGATTLNLDGGYATLTLNGTISGSGNLAKVSTGTVNLNAANTYAGTTTINTGTLQIGNAAATLGAGNVNISSGATLSYAVGTTTPVANNISGAGNFSSTNGGQTLSGTNTFTGTSYIGAGTVTLPGGFATNLASTSQLSLGFSNGFTSTVVDSAATADTTSIPILLTGNGALNFNGSGSLVAGGAVTNNDANNKLFTLRGTGVATYSGVIGGGGAGVISLTKTDTGTWLLTNAETYTGATTISNGKLQLGSGGTTGSLVPAGTIVNNGTIVFNRSNGVTQGTDFSSAAISGSGALIQAGVGNLSLTATNTYTGLTTINAGTLSLTGGTGQPGGVLASPQIIVNSGGTLALNPTGNDILGYTGGRNALVINSGGTVLQTGAQRATIQNVITMTGGLLTASSTTPGSFELNTTAGITATSDTAGNPALISVLPIALNVTPTFNVSRGTASPASDLTISSILSNFTSTAQGIIKTGNGILTLSSANTYTGPTNVSAGTLVLTATPAGTSAITVNAGATLDLATGNAIGQTNGRAAITINGGTVTTITDPITGTNDAYAGFSNPLTMVGGTLAQGASIYGNVYIVGTTYPVIATSDATGNPAIISANVGIGGNGTVPQTFNVSQGALAPASDLTITGALINNGAVASSILKTGNGILTLSAFNSFTGGTTVNSGTVVLTKGGATGTIRGPLTINGGTVKTTVADAIGFSNGSNVTLLTVNASGVFDIATTGNEGFLTNLNLSGGTVTSTGGGAFNFAGGFNISSTGSTTPSLISAPIVLRGAGLNIITTAGVSSGADLTLAAPISYGAGGSGPITTSGTGKLQITVASNYSSATIITGGTLAAGANNVLSPSSAFNVSAGTLDTSAYNNSIASLIVGNSGTLNLGVSTLLTDTGTASLDGTLNVIGSPASVPVSLMTYLSETGTFATANLPSGYSLSYTPTALLLIASGPANLVYLNANGTWDTATSASFNGGSGPTVFHTADHVLFDDTYSAGPYTVPISGTVIPGSTTFNDSTGNYVVTGSTGTSGIGGTGSLTKYGAGSLTLSTSNSYTGGTNVSAGKLILASASAFPVNTSLTIASGATVQMANHGSGSTYVATISKLANSGMIDLTNNAMVIHNASGSIGVYNAQIANAYNGGAWNDTNTSSGVITSSAAATDTTHLTAVGVATGLTTFQGGTVATTDVLVKYTYYGDADLSGAVDGSDYSLIDNGYLQGLTGWQNGDFNYDGVVNGSDYTLIDNALNTQGSQIAAEIAAPTAQLVGGAGVAAVPEPTTLGFLGIGILGLLGRRNRRCR